MLRSGAPGGTCRRPAPAPPQPPLYLQDLVQPLLAQARELLEQLRFLPLVVVGSRAPVRLLQHLEDRRPDGQVEDDSRGQQGAPVHHGAGGRAGGPGRLPRAAAVGARSRPVLPLTPLPFPAVRRASSPGFCRVPLEPSTLPSHSLLLLPPFFPPSSAPLPPAACFPRFSPLPPQQRFEFGALPLPPPTRPRMRGCRRGKGRRGSRGSSRPRREAVPPPRGGRARLGPAVAIARPRGAARGKGSGAATSPLPALPARTRGPLR